MSVTGPLVLGIVSKVSMYRNIGISKYRKFVDSLVLGTVSKVSIY